MMVSLIAELNLESLLDTNGAALPKNVEESVAKVVEQGGWNSLTGIMDQVSRPFI
jgi:hypothetical protein